MLQKHILRDKPPMYICGKSNIIRPLFGYLRQYCSVIYGDIVRLFMESNKKILYVIYDIT